jgi:hypothetical protein
MTRQEVLTERLRAARLQLEVAEGRAEEARELIQHWTQELEALAPTMPAPDAEAKS